MQQPAQLSTTAPSMPFHCGTFDGACVGGKSRVAWNMTFPFPEDGASVEACRGSLFSLPWQWWSPEKPKVQNPKGCLGSSSNGWHPWHSLKGTRHSAISCCKRKGGLGSKDEIMYHRCCEVVCAKCSLYALSALSSWFPLPEFLFKRPEDYSLTPCIFSSAI